MKIVRYALFSLVALFGLVLGLGWLAKENASDLIAYFIARKTGTPVTIERVSFFQEGIVISGLRLASPYPSKLNTALRIETISILTPLENFFNNPTEIRLIELQQIYLGIEFYNPSRTKGNWVTLMNRISSNQDHLKPEQYAVVKDLWLKQLHVELLLPGSKPKTVPTIQELHFENVRTDEGFLAEELTEVIIQKMMEQVFILRGIQTIVEMPSSLTEGIFQLFLAPFSK